jgi:hypothetical protein
LRLGGELVPSAPELVEKAALLIGFLD